MLDWFSGYVGYDASQVAVGLVVRADRHGEMVWQRHSWETAVGSYASGVQVTRGQSTEQMRKHAESMGFLCSNEVLRISGNPTKFLQGHNAAGPSVADLGPVLQALVRCFGEGLRPSNADEPMLPAVQRSRVDVTTAVDLGSHQAVHDWIALAAATGRSRHGRAMASGTTVYWGKNSTAWTLKAYCKHCELVAHPPDGLMVSPGLVAELLEWTRAQLRIELTLRRPELRNRGSLDESVIWEFFKKVEISVMTSKPEAAEQLRTQARAMLQLWFNGTDVKAFYPKATLYRVRKEILAATGVDVLLPCSEQPKAARPVLLELEELRAREVTQIPARIQRSLFGAAV